MNFKPLYFAIAFLVYFYASSSVFAQDYEVDPLFNTNIKSPQTADFMRYGNIPVNKNVGQIDLKIPIYTYQDNDFNLPIYIGYNSAGFMPSKRDGIVGLNWFLNAGGMITRNVVGVPDEVDGNIALSSLHVTGFLKGTRNKTHDQDDVFQFNSNAYESTMAMSTLKDSDNSSVSDNYETESDEYTFNFAGYSGKFMINNQGQAQVISGNIVNIDLSGIETKYAIEVPKYSRIIVTTNDGFEYHFGGDQKYFEFSFDIDENGSSENSTYTIDAWHINKIVATNGRTVFYKYRDNGPYVHKDFVRNATDPEHFIYNEYFNEMVEKSQWQTTNACGGKFASCRTVNLSSEENRSWSRRIIKTVYLEQIKIGNNSINFEYENKEQKFYLKNGNYKGYNQLGLRVSSINIHNGINEVKKFGFKYKYLGGSLIDDEYSKRYVGGRMFLYKLEESGKNPYTFYYNVDETLPDPNTLALDHWGFWNKKNNTTLVPQVSFETVSQLQDKDGNAIYSDGKRDPSSSTYDVAMLKEVKYPTGGYSKFEYESHHYSKRIERRGENEPGYNLAFLPRLYDEIDIAGGGRIKTITDGDALGNETVKNYFYSKNFITDGTEGTSSGILLTWPRYYFFWQNLDETAITIRLRNTSFNQSVQDGSYITYSEVTEVTGETKVVSKYSDYETNPDETFVMEVSNKIVVIAYLTAKPFWLYQNYVGLKKNDLSKERGLLKTEQFYDASNNLVKLVEYTYNEDPNRFNQYTVGIVTSGALAESYKNYYYHNKLTKVKSTQYDQLNGNKKITNYTEYDYDKSLHNLKEQRQYNSINNVRYITKYKYVSDYIDNLKNMTTGDEVSQAVKAMINSYNIKNPIQILSLKGTDLIGGRIYTYKNYQSGTNSISKLSGTYKLLIDNGVQYTNDYNATFNVENNGSGVFSSEFIMHPNFQLQHTFTSYDAFGNILSDTDISGTTRQYEWTNHIPKLLKSITINPSGINQKTSYEQIPLVGVTKITDSNGKEITYEYDEANRLIIIRNHNGEIIQQNDYKYINEIE